MSLREWVRKKRLTEHKSSPEEIKGLLGLADRDLAACRTPGLATDWRFNIAYNAALQASIAALAAAGYRASREAHHYRVIQSLVFTIAADPQLVRRFDAFRKKRNLTSYELGGAVSSREADEMAALAGELRRKVARWIKANHPELM